MMTPMSTVVTVACITETNESSNTTLYTVLCDFWCTKCWQTFLWFCSGNAGTYKLDIYGDRDVKLSVIYTTIHNKVFFFFCVNQYFIELFWICSVLCWNMSSAPLTYPQYRYLFTFDTEYNKTEVTEKDPAFIWGKKLPNFKPDKGTDRTHTLHFCTYRCHQHSMSGGCFLKTKCV